MVDPLRRYAELVATRTARAALTAQAIVTELLPMSLASARVYAIAAGLQSHNDVEAQLRRFIGLDPTHSNLTTPHVSPAASIGYRRPCAEASC